MYRELLILDFPLKEGYSFVFIKQYDYIVKDIYILYKEKIVANLYWGSGFKIEGDINNFHYSYIFDEVIPFIKKTFQLLEVGEMKKNSTILELRQINLSKAGLI